MPARRGPARRLRRGGAGPHRALPPAGGPAMTDTELAAVRNRLCGVHPGPWASDQDFLDRGVQPLVAEVARLRAHEAETLAMLRIVCGELGDNDWPDDLHFADVLEKHLADP